MERRGWLAVAQGGPGSTSDEHFLLQVILECQQFLPNVRELARPAEVAGWRSLAAKAIGGHTSTFSENGSTPERNAQVALYVAGLGHRQAMR